MGLGLDERLVSIRRAGSYVPIVDAEAHLVRGRGRARGRGRGRGRVIGLDSWSVGMEAHLQRQQRAAEGDEEAQCLDELQLGHHCLGALR